jgi:hypothetical protein
VNGYGPRMHKLAALALLACVAALAGCGDGGKDKTATSDAAPLTKAQYVTKADAICATSMQQITTAGARLRAATKKTGKLPPRDVIVKFLTTTSLPTYDRMIDRLRTLTPPAADAKTIDGYIASLAGAVDKVKADPATYAEDPFDDANARAKSYGLEVCGS